jgi:hypothetical protein
MYTAHFWKAASERAVKTVAQALVALIGAASLDVLTVDWSQAVSVALGAGLVSLLTSIGSVQLTHHDDPSLV